MYAYLFIKINIISDIIKILSEKKQIRKCLGICDFQFYLNKLLAKDAINYHYF